MIAALLGLGTVAFTHAALRPRFRPATAALATGLLASATLLPWYAVVEPQPRVVLAAFAVAVAVWAGCRPSPARFRGGAGLALLVAMVATALTLAPSAGPPAGIDRPHVLDLLFSSRHGLVAWTPVIGIGLLGYLPLARRQPALALALGLPLALLTSWVASRRDWWGGDGFSNPRFAGALPLVAFGLAAGLEWAEDQLRRRPGAALALLTAGAAFWNAALMEEIRRGLVPRDDTVAFPRVVEAAMEVTADTMGSPPTWPASWLFALTTGASPAQYDRLVGRTLLAEAAEETIRPADPEGQAFLGGGWGGAETRGAERGRRTRGRARLLLPLAEPQDVQLLLRLRALDEPGPVEVRLNGRALGTAAALEDWTTSRLRAGPDEWHGDPSTLSLDGEGRGLLVAAVTLARITPLARRASRP